MSVRDVTEHVARIAVARRAGGYEVRAAYLDTFIERGPCMTHTEAKNLGIEALAEALGKYWAPGYEFPFRIHMVPWSTLYWNTIRR